MPLNIGSVRIFKTLKLYMKKEKETTSNCTLPIFKGIQKAYKRQKLCNFHNMDLPIAFRGIRLLRERHLYLQKVIFFKIYRILPIGGENVSALEGIFL